ncbi:acyl-CoA thioesterase [Chitinophagaceae bacterium MMS25-I14]
MISVKTQLSIRWADIDPNFHLRHSVYYDFAAQMRTEVLTQMGITMESMRDDHFGPVLFREECIFRKEIRFGENIFLTVRISRLREDYGRFSMQHEFCREDGTVCAVLNIDGAWMNTHTRKLTIPPQGACAVIDAIPKTADFTWEKSSQNPG